MMHTKNDLVQFYLDLIWENVAALTQTVSVAFSTLAFLGGQR